jgi:hypothetical protein
MGRPLHGGIEHHRRDECPPHEAAGNLKTAGPTRTIFLVEWVNQRFHHSDV